MPALRADVPVYGGYVLSRDEGVVFIKGAIPGELVEVSVREKKKDYSIAHVTEIIESSPFRVSPHCRYFGDCGGCQLQFASYEKQVEMKNEVLADCLRRIGRVEITLSPALTGRDFNYRHRGQFKVFQEGKVGFYREGTRDIVDIEECPLMTGGINDILKKVRASALVAIREIHITLGDSLIAYVIGRGFDEVLAGEFIAMGFSGVAFEDGSHRGSGHVGFDLLGLPYTVSPWSFLQSNWALNIKVAEMIVEEAKLLEGKRVLDLYAGAGNFSLPLSPHALEVVAVEENPHAIKDGQRNLSLGGIKNMKFVKGTAEAAKVGGAFDVLIIDPPRPGLAKEALRRVLEMAPKRIIYVSCNPATFSRDLKGLCEKYSLQSVRLVDLFPNTYHIESVAFLTAK